MLNIRLAECIQIWLDTSVHGENWFISDEGGECLLCYRNRPEGAAIHYVVDDQKVYTCCRRLITLDCRPYEFNAGDPHFFDLLGKHLSADVEVLASLGGLNAQRK